jgi:cystathionine gamma-synthase
VAKDTNWGTLSVHGAEPRKKAFDAVTTPVVASATYAFKDTAEIAGYFQGDFLREEYGRYGNPTVRAAEAKLAALDGAQAAALFSCGMSAITTALFALVKSGDHVILTSDGYRRTRQFVTQVLARLGVEHSLVHPGSREQLMKALRPGRTMAIVGESPTNPYLHVADLSMFAEARDACPGANLLVDSTFATPINQRPIELGADLVIHSCTKYLGGHNDLLAGSIAGRAPLVEMISELRGVLGGVLDPHSAFLLIRGLKTLPLRVHRQNETALHVARFLEQHPRVKRVFYPGLESHPDHALAMRTMRGFGGVVSFRVKGTAQEVSKVIDACRLATIAPSLGATETLIEQPALMSYFDKTTEEREAIGIFDDLIRLSVGLEDAEDIVNDLSQALQP